MAHDIERYLHDEPVAAGPPSALYKFRKFARRNSGPLVAAALVLLALLVGMIGTTWGMIRAEAARRDAVAAQRAEADRAEGESKAKEEARAAADAEKKAKQTAQEREAEMRAVLDFVENKIFSAARPKDQAGGQGYDVKLAEAVKAALPFVDKSFIPQPLIEARLRTTMGLSFWYLGDAKTAIEQFQAARQLYTAHRGPDHTDTLKTMHNLANSYADAGRSHEALKLREETLRLMKAKLGPDAADTLKSMNTLAESYRAAGRSREALKLHEETLRLMKAKLGPDYPDTLHSMINLANSYDAAGRTQEALKLREETLPLTKAKLGPDHPDTLMSMNNLAASYYVAGRTQEALRLREETLPLMRAKLGPDHPRTLLSMNNLANSYDAAGRTQEALKLHEETLQLRKAKLGLDHPDTLHSLNDLANSYLAAGRTQEALKLHEEALQLRKAKLGPDHPNTLIAMNNLADSYITAGEAAKAVALLQETLALRDRRAKVEPGNSLEQTFMAWTHGQMGEAEQTRLDYAAAVQAYARSVKMSEKLDQGGVLKDSFSRSVLNEYRQRLALCRKAEQAVNDLDFALKQPAAEVAALLDMRVRYLLKEQKLPAAVESAAKMKERAGDKAQQLYNAARAYALCAGAAKQAKGPVASAPGSEKLASEALALLKQAVAKGYKNAAHMKQDKDLAVLRERTDFQKLLAESEAGSGKK
jgi:hypothetical protein